ncbi:MAG: heme exporter protein CcmB [SAR324 cluster bacterium]|nr:heme exporter protein CcmB [SAR324 cluster bacterium]
MIEFIRQIGILTWKDVMIDIRRKENFLSMFLFSLLTLIVFNFSIGEDPKLFRLMIPGIIWVVFLMAGVLGLSKAFIQEIENGCIKGLLLTPMDRGNLFLGKMLGTTIFLTLVQSLIVPMFILFFGVNLSGNWAVLALVMFAGTFGFTALGTLLAGMTATLRGREMLLPILLFPLMTPNLISVVHITAYVFFGGEWDEVLSWWKLLISFDILIAVVSYLSFEFILEE